MNYIEINGFVKYLKKYRRRLSKQQIKAIRGQALSGDLAGAKKGLAKLLWKGKINGDTENSRFPA